MYSTMFLPMDFKYILFDLVYIHLCESFMADLCYLNCSILCSLYRFNLFDIKYYL